MSERVQSINEVIVASVRADLDRVADEVAQSNEDVKHNEDRAEGMERLTRVIADLDAVAAKLAAIH